MPKIMKKKCVMAKRASILRRMLHLRQEIGSSNDLNACENDNIIDNSVTSLFVSMGEITHDNEVRNVIDVLYPELLATEAWE
ncbi:hypothetical protein PUN28_013923 [Cardiocondyla obscurior]|uniref:Uncharacterized protein n=1 Tax=Cardiocondyla obscurior TaxID=286306 RepID=A0AAW2F6X8_9HYME